MCERRERHRDRGRDRGTGTDRQIVTWTHMEAIQKQRGEHTHTRTQNETETGRENGVTPAKSTTKGPCYYVQVVPLSVLNSLEVERLLVHGHLRA